PPSASRRGGLALGVLVPHGVAIVVRGRDLHETIPDLGAPKLLFRGHARDVALQHDIAVVGRSGLAPSVLREQIEQTCDLGETLRLFEHVLTQPRRICALALVLTIELVANGAEDVDEDVGGAWHRMIVTAMACARA